MKNILRMCGTSRAPEKADALVKHAETLHKCSHPGDSETCDRAQEAADLNYTRVERQCHKLGFLYEMQDVRSLIMGAMGTMRFQIH